MPRQFRRSNCWRDEARRIAMNIAKLPEHCGEHRQAAGASTEGLMRECRAVIDLVHYLVSEGCHGSYS
jgi:hypothetical protein